MLREGPQRTQLLAYRREVDCERAEKKDGRNLKPWVTVWHRAACLPTLDPHVKEKQTSWTFNLCNVGSVCYNSQVLYPRVAVLGSSCLAENLQILNKILNKPMVSKITAIIWEAIQRADVRRILAQNIFKSCRHTGKLASVVFFSQLIWCNVKKLGLPWASRKYLIKAKHWINSNPLHFFKASKVFITGKMWTWRKND